MSDMLVKLYELPEVSSVLQDLNSKGIEIRPAIAPEKRIVVNYARENHSKAWGDEVDIAFSRQPVSCLIAIKDNKLIGFACYDATYLNFFGPTGVKEEYRGMGIGKALLLKTLQTMKNKGYGYAIIGGVGPAEFYSKVCNAKIIEGSKPGIYRGMLKED